MDFIGTLFVAAAWVTALVVMLQKRTAKVQPLFLILYLVGIFLIAVDGYASGATSTAFLNLVSLGASFWMTLTLRRLNS